MRITFAATAAVLVLLAGCTGDAPPVDLSTVTDAPASLLAGPPLWNDPQNAPHPAYGWATLSHPPAGDMPQWWQPIPNATLPSPVTGLEHLASAEGLDAGAGIALFGSLAVVPDFGGNVHFVDISDPAKPVKLSSVDSSGRGAAVIAYPDGRLVAAVSTGSGFDVIEFTDPHNPEILAEVEPRQGGHKLGVVPGTPIVYNAASNGGSPNFLIPDPCQISIDRCTGFTEIYDLSDPAEPVLVQEFPNGLSCHHVFFWSDAAQNKSRAICAGLQYTQIWDIADPLNPKVIVSIPVHHGRAGGPSGMASVLAFSHSAGLNQDGTVLYVGDESGGGGLPPGCGASVDTPAGSPSTPIGAVWFYDVSDETSPQVLGYYSPTQDPRVTNLRSCTAHHGRLVPEAGRDLLAMSFYGSGVILIDFTGVGTPGGPVPSAVAQFAEGSDTWETWYYNGHLITGDLNRGLDVFRLT